MEKVKYPDVSLVVQGPLTDKMDFFENLGYYKSLFSQIILSTYSEHLAINKDFVYFCVMNNITIVHQTIDIGDVRNDGRAYYQVYTTLEGLKYSSKKYTIKHRIDERYSNLEKIVDKFLLDDSKMVCGSMVFGPKYYRHYHAGDHMFIAKTDKLLQTFQLTFDNLNKGIMENNNSGAFPDTNLNSGSPEITMTKNFIRINGEEPTEERHDELMLKYFDIVNNKELHPFIIRENGINKVYNSIEDLTPNRNQYETMNDILTKEHLPGYH